jgi:hypothetical protein
MHFFAVGKFCYSVHFLQSLQGCRMVDFHTKPPNVGTLGKASEWKILIYFMNFVVICFFTANLLYFVVIYYIFSVLVYFTTKIWQPLVAPFFAAFAKINSC